MVKFCSSPEGLADGQTTAGLLPLLAVAAAIGTRILWGRDGCRLDGRLGVLQRLGDGAGGVAATAASSSGGCPGCGTRCPRCGRGAVPGPRGDVSPATRGGGRGDRARSRHRSWREGLPSGAPRRCALPCHQR